MPGTDFKVRAETDAFPRWLPLPLLTALLCLFFLDVVSAKKTFQTAGYEAIAGVLTNGAYGYTGEPVRTKDWPVWDPASSAYNEEIFPYVNHRSYSRFRLPLWNPYSACGTPVAANPISCAYYPLAFLTFVAPSSYTWDLFILLRLLLAGYLTYLFVRSLGISREGACVSGAIFMLSGYMVNYLNLFHLNVEVLVPGLFWAVERIFQKTRWKDFLFFTLFYALMIVGGNPESLILATLGVMCYFVLRMFLERGWGFRKRVAVFLLTFTCVVMALLLTSFFLFPFLEFYSQSRHTHKASIGTMFLAIYQTITMMSPRFYDPLYARSLTYAMCYVGIVATLLCAFCISREKRLRYVALFFIILVCLFYAKITAFRFINWIGTLPVMNLIYYTKYCSEFYLGVAILAGLGFHNISRKKAHLTATYALVVVYVLLYILLFARNLQKFPLAAQRDQIRETFALTQLFLVPGILITLGALRLRKEKWRTLLVWIVPAFLLFELYYYLPKTRADRHDAHATAPYVEFLKSRTGNRPERIYGIDVTLFPLNSSIFGLQDIRSFSALEVERYWKYMKQFMTIPFIPTRKEMIFEDMFTGTQFPDIIYSRYFDLLGVKYAVGEYYLNIPSFHEHLVNTCTVLPEAKEDIVRGYRDGYYYIGALTPAEIIYETTIPPEGDTLMFDTYVDGKEYWKLKGGIRFTVTLVTDGQEKQLFTRTINPASNIADREWHTFTISLDEYAGRRVSLHFITEGDVVTGQAVKALWRILYLTSWEQKLRTNFKLIYDREVKIYENGDAFPRAFFVPHAKYVANEEDLIAAMEADDFNPAEQVLLEEPPPDATAARRATSADQLSTHSTVTRYEATDIEIKVRNAAPGYLVLSDSYYPGWRAYVDGAPAKIYRADYFLRAVFIQDAGEHTVRFRYEPRSLFLGFAVSGIGLAAILALFFLGKVPQKVLPSRNET